MKRSISRQLLEPHSSSSDTTVESTITCTICYATYTPSRHHTYLLRASSIALESAFISMCHFCFRCRRPSCLNCWDNVHGVCGQCAHETHVSFRLKTPPLEGISPLSPRLDFPVDERFTSPSLVSVHPGRFQQLPSSPISSSNTWGEPSPTSQIHSPVKSVGTFIAPSPVDIDRIETRPNRSRSLDIDRIETHPDRSGYLERIKTHPARSISRYTKKRVTHPIPSSTNILARILIVIAFLAIFLIVIGITAAYISMYVNIFIYKVLHIDIHAELLSLWHLLDTLF